MPHIILETTADLFENANIPDILEALVAKLCTYETIDSKAVKAYHNLRSNWSMGESAPAGFAHCTVGMLSGRPLELRQQIAKGMYEEMISHFTMSRENNEVSLTLELREFDGDTYQKM
jgi:5-carboxymethyl-2-hydroxymuconate isomerase